MNSDSLGERSRNVEVFCRRKYKRLFNHGLHGLGPPDKATTMQTCHSAEVDPAVPIRIRG